MGLFGDIIDPTELKVATHTPGDHPGKITDLLQKKSEAGDDYIVIKYDIGEDYDLQDWFQITNKPQEQWDDEREVRKTARGKKQTEKDILTQSYRNLKRRLLSFGVAEENVNKVGRDDLVGLDVILSTSLNKRGYAQIDKVTLPGASGTSLPNAAAAAAAFGSPTPGATAAASPVEDKVPAGNPFA